MFGINVKVAAVHVKTNQPQLLPNHVLQRKQNYSIEGGRMTSLSVSSLYLSVNSDKRTPVF